MPTPVLAQGAYVAIGSCASLALAIDADACGILPYFLALNEKVFLLAYTSIPKRDINIQDFCATYIAMYRETERQREVFANIVTIHILFFWKAHARTICTQMCR